MVSTSGTSDISSVGNTDVIVIGGGPSGSTVSTLIAQQGYKVTLFEREHFPRFHIGESLIPETYWVLKRLNMLPKMRKTQFVKKHSVQFVTEKGKLSEPFYFSDNKPHECSQTWQVMRSEFDHMMIKNAAEHGVQVHEGVRVLEVLFEGTRAVGVKVADERGNVRDVFASVVVDASGQSSMIMSRLGLREWDQELKKAALWTYWEDAYRDKGRDEGATIVLQTQGKKGWFWYIPLHNNILSVGVVADYSYLFKDRETKDHEAVYFEEVAKCPGLQPRLEGAKRIAPYRAAKEYSYRSREVAGDGWVLVGDAFGFLDPLYSSGVLLALRSGELAADAVVAGLREGDTSGAKLGAWGPNYIQGMERMRRLVCEFYNGFSFGKFVKLYPQLKGHLTDLLIGDLFDEKVDDVVEPMNHIRRLQAEKSAALPVE
ncbi:tryptophan halogenase [Pirellula staleyi DSM 6068]|uniref:Tryptophan halogenase n=1 Tax=Pirellula staleyi (strain ATCC 27377 / DSM 6068 / ICPB 4128) TaxID=530564 RepID=D2R1S0_PIRSD|nr:NAD(P)/FAD-dependent oxidoreductase [Pirellula staleyi]ADB16789.1 tryptophan halogenase [Pirellula staleyi DSM 6068]